MSIRRPALSGLTLVELILVMVMTGMIFGVIQMLMARTIDSWWKVNANQDSEQQLYRAQTSLERDLRGAAFELEPDRATIGIQKGPTQLRHLAGADGDVLWFLSAVDPLSGQFVRRPDGTPFWQRNIVYYTVTPLGLDALGFQGGGREVGGYEVACPFKMLVRKEIDHGPPTRPGSDPVSSVEVLMTFDELVPHLNRPTGYSCAGMTGPNSSVKPVSAHLLTFQANLMPRLRGVAIDLRSTAIDRARREAPLGQRDLSVDPATTQLQFLAVPPNRPPAP